MKSYAEVKNILERNLIISIKCVGNPINHNRILYEKLC